MKVSKSGKIKKGLIVQKIDNETVIYDVEQAKMHTINETASFIFQKIKTIKNSEEVVNKLVKKYNITKDEARKDVNDFIKTLIKQKILVN